MADGVLDSPTLLIVGMVILASSLLGVWLGSKSRRFETLSERRFSAVDEAITSYHSAIEGTKDEIVGKLVGLDGALADVAQTVDEAHEDAGRRLERLGETLAAVRDRVAAASEKSASRLDGLDRKLDDVARTVDGAREDSGRRSDGLGETLGTLDGAIAGVARKVAAARKVAGNRFDTLDKGFEELEKSMKNLNFSIEDSEHIEGGRK